MTDLSALKGFCGSIHNVPTILYFHENQFAYPDQGDPNHVVERQITSLYSAIAAEQLVFNSKFNKTTFLQGVKRLLKKLPDGIPSGIVESLENKSEIISVPLMPLTPLPSPSQNDIPSSVAPAEVIDIVWNHRWEHDKGTEALETIVSMLVKSGIDFRFHLIGQSFRKIPQSVENSISLLEQYQRLGTSGFIENRDEYLDLLAHSQIVLSTAQHEFQGLAVLEAIQAGCIPVVPDALAYQEFVDSQFRYSDVNEALLLIKRFADAQDSIAPELPESVNFSFVASAWDRLISEML
jgi:glycosyltransferase involved in cell wall biosynthesis